MFHVEQSTGAGIVTILVVTHKEREAKESFAAGVTDCGAHQSPPDACVTPPLKWRCRVSVSGGAG
jgi:hypothetical protein